jgi:hypothetical protein
VLCFSLAWVGHMDITLQINLCFDLVFKAIVKAQRRFFSLTGVCHMYIKLEGIFYKKV